MMRYLLGLILWQKTHLFSHTHTHTHTLSLSLTQNHTHTYTHIMLHLLFHFRFNAILYWIHSKSSLWNCAIYWQSVEDRSTKHMCSFQIKDQNTLSKSSFIQIAEHSRSLYTGSPARWGYHVTARGQGRCQDAEPSERAVDGWSELELDWEILALPMASRNNMATSAWVSTESSVIWTACLTHTWTCLSNPVNKRLFLRS